MYFTGLSLEGCLCCFLVIWAIKWLINAHCWLFCIIVAVDYCSEWIIANSDDFVAVSLFAKCISIAYLLILYNSSISIILTSFVQIVCTILLLPQLNSFTVDLGAGPLFFILFYYCFVFWEFVYPQFKMINFNLRVYRDCSLFFSWSVTDCCIIVDHLKG